MIVVIHTLASVSHTCFRRSLHVKHFAVCFTCHAITQCRCTTRTLSRLRSIAFRSRTCGCTAVQQSKCWRSTRHHHKVCPRGLTSSSFFSSLFSLVFCAGSQVRSFAFLASKSIMPMIRRITTLIEVFFICFTTLLQRHAHLAYNVADTRH